MSSNNENHHEANCLIVNYVLSTGQKGTLPLNKEQCIYFLGCIDKNKTIILQIGDEIRTLNPLYVAFTYIKGMNKNEYEILVKTNNAIEKVIQQNNTNEEPIQKVESSDVLAKAYNSSRELFQIECKCGEEYQREYVPFTQKNSCDKCKEMVFVDRKKGKQESENGLVWIMTNRYFVEREFTYAKATY